MKSLTTLLMFAMVTITGCATQYKVSLSSPTEVYVGTLTFDGPYTGELTIPKGPEGESFAGRYVATDMTPQAFAVGGTGQIDARGVWTGRGSRGTPLTAEVTVGRGGHGIGKAKDTNGKEYQISF